MIMRIFCRFIQRSAVAPRRSCDARTPDQRRTDRISGLARQIEMRRDAVMRPTTAAAGLEATPMQVALAALNAINPR
jgi:hypothetical protein